VILRPGSSPPRHSEKPGSGADLPAGSLHRPSWSPRSRLLSIRNSNCSSAARRGDRFLLQTRQALFPGDNPGDGERQQSRVANVKKIRSKRGISISPERDPADRKAACSYSHGDQGANSTWFPEPAGTVKNPSVTLSSTRQSITAIRAITPPRLQHGARTGMQSGESQS